MTLFREVRDRAPVLLQFHVSLSTTDIQKRSPADLVFAGQRAFLMDYVIVELRGFEPPTPTLPVW